MKQFKQSARYQRAYAAFKQSSEVKRVLIALAAITAVSVIVACAS